MCFEVGYAALLYFQNNYLKKTQNIYTIGANYCGVICCMPENGGKKRGRKKSVAYCSVCEAKIKIQDSYIIGNKKVACKKCFKKIVKQKKSKNGTCPSCSCSKGVSNCE